jgi:hypothetical protein
MKQLSFILFFLVLFCGTASADRRPIVIQNGGAVGDHFELPAPADEPDVYYDSDNQEIIIDGLGFVNYYDVEIATAASYVTVLTTQVNGSYDTIDISSLPQSHYIITIESPLGNTFEGYFDTNSKLKSPI